MANARILKDQLEEMGERIAADPNTPADFLRFLFLWKAHQAAVAESMALLPITLVPPRGAGFVPRPKEVQPTAYEAKKEIILSAVRQTLMGLGLNEPVKTSVIFDLLPREVAQTIPGQDPRSNLSAMIHNSKRFISHGRSGWTLPEVISGAAVGSGSRKEEEPQETI